MTDRLKRDILSKIEIAEEALEEVLASFRKVAVAKNKPLLRRNEICGSYYFLEQGCIRVSCLVNEKDETPWIAFENTFFTDVFSIHTQQQSKIEFVALEDSVVLEIHKDRLWELSNRFPSLKDYLRTTWELHFKRIVEIKLMQYGTAKDQYAFFLENREWMQRVPQKYLASVMGVTPFSLSRIRRKA